MHYRRIGLAALLTLIFTISSIPANFLRLFQTSQVLAQTANSRKEEAKILLQQGVAQLSNGQISNARESLQKALTIYREIKDRQSESAALFFLGVTYREQREYATAIDYYQQALKIEQQLPNHANKGVTLIHLGDTYRLLNNYTQAIQYYQQFLALDKQLQDNENRIAALGNLGIVYLDLENYAAAIDVFRQGLALAREIPNSSAVMQFLRGLSSAYYYIADYDQAIEYSQQSLAISRRLDASRIARTVKDLDGESGALNSLGNIYYQKKEFDKAIDYYQQVLAIARSQKNRLAEGGALGNIGLTYTSKGEAAKAIDYLEKDLAIQREFRDRLNEGQTLGYLGRAYSQLKNYNKAVEYYQQSLAIAREIKYTRGEGITLYNLGITLIELGKLPEAEKNLLTAVEVWESLREKLGKNDTYKVSIFEDQAKTYRLLEKVLINQKKYDEALVISERGRARAFVDLLASRLSANAKGGTTQLLEPKVDKPTLPLLQQIAKQQNATLVEYSINSVTIRKDKTDAGLNIWVIKPTGEVTFRRGNLSPMLKQENINIGQIVAIGRNAIGAGGRGGLYVTPDAPKAKNQFKLLHELLIKPIADLLPTKESDHVIFIPHTSLFLVPFAALQDEQGKYLISKHTILTAPSIQVLDFTYKQKLRQSTKSASKLNLIVGNPTMPKVILEPGKPPEQLIALPGAEKEAKDVASILKTQALTGNKASKTAIVQKISQAGIIHFATHGLLDDNRGLGSAIALAPDPSPSSPSKPGEINGLLTAEEILAMKLQAELVVLSACDTGRGRITGDGVIGLSRSLISAGVPSVMVSLWSIPDAPTADLMTQFYKNFLQRKLDKATALREAMLSTMKTHPNPRDWAAFTLIGESK